MKANFRPSTSCCRLSLTVSSGKYSTASSNIPWTVTSHNSLEQDKLTIYCGGENFTPDDNLNNAWIDLTSGIVVYGLDHNGDLGASVCGPNGLAFTLDSSSNTQANAPDYKIVVLCDGALIKGSSPDSTGSQSGVAAIAALNGNAGLYPGKIIDNISYTTALSFTLLHEMMHVTQSSSCKYPSGQ